MLKTIDMEIALMKYFGVRENIIVPNISWGIQIHECDLLIVRSSGYCIEVEIKVSKQDLKADFEKRHKHKDKANRIKEFYYALPYSLYGTCKELIPEESGLLLVHDNLKVVVVKSPRINTNSKKLEEKEIRHILHLGCMRICTLKQKISKLQKSK